MLIVIKCFLRCWIHHFEFEVCSSYCQTGWQVQKLMQDCVDANIIFIFRVFWNFHFRRTFSFMGNDTLRGTPFLHRGSSFWINVEQTSPVSQDRGTWSQVPRLTTRDVCAQNSEPHLKSMLLVGFLIPAQTYVCFGPSFAGVLSSRPIACSGSLGRNFHYFKFSFSPIIHGG